MIRRPTTFFLFGSILGFFSGSSVVSGKQQDGGEPMWWQPLPGVTWAWQLSGPLDLSLDVDMYDVDLDRTPRDAIRSLHLAGRSVVCYFSAGAYEDHRPDSELLPREAIGNRLNGTDGSSWWLDFRSDGVKTVMEERLDRAVEKLCDGVDLANVDAYLHDTGFGAAISDLDQLTYNKWLAEQAHRRNLSVGLRNDLQQAGQLVDFFDWAVNDECWENRQRCNKLNVFVDAGKAAFGVIYDDDLNNPHTLGFDEFCSSKNVSRFSLLKKHRNVNASHVSCKKNDEPSSWPLHKKLPKNTLQKNQPV